MKAKVNMTNWELYVYDGFYNLSGCADYHPRLGKQANVRRTSDLQKYSLEEDVLYYETRNTIYVCPLKYMRTKLYETVCAEYIEELSHLAEHSDCILDQIIAASACIVLGKIRYQLTARIMKLQEVGQQELYQREEEENHRMYEILQGYEDSVYIEMRDICDGGKLAYHMGEKFGIVKAWVHGGMFQDSVVYAYNVCEETIPESIDFRYFPNDWHNRMETYMWAPEIKNVILKNETGEVLSFNEQKIEVGETKVFPNQQ